MRVFGSMLGVGALLALCVGCASMRQNIPILSSWPTRPSAVVGYVSAAGGESEALRTARELNADALIVVDPSRNRTQLGPPRTTHIIGMSVTEVGGAGHSFDAAVRNYVAIKWLPTSESAK